MIFNDFLFLFGFLPLVLILFYLPFLRRFRVVLIFLLSLLFYEFAGGVRHVLVLLASIGWVYAFAVLLPIQRNKVYLASAIFLPVAALAYFKYRYFVVHEIMGITTDQGQVRFSLFEDSILPAGISFFTFQLISFAIDRYRGMEEKPAHFFQFCFYISFFPQLVAGPILRFPQVNERIRRIAEFMPKRDDLIVAVVLFVCGLAVKVLLADTLGRYLGPMTTKPDTLDVISRLFVVFGYSNQIYFDFYGYSLMAMGLGRVFGFQFPENFRMPYTAPNPKVFWRQWHVTLSFWIRDYLYVPLGGNRHHVRNIIIVFAAVGLWHGAGWNFIIWGLYHAFWVLLYHFVRAPWDRMPSVIQIGVTFIIVSVGWVLFIFDTTTSVQFVVGIFSAPWIVLGFAALEAWGIVLVATVVAVRCDFVRLSVAACEPTKFARNFSVVIGILLCVGLLFVDTSKTFIYFRF
jgi:alginate O-acetyltransferase complex protein AlgI